jgi:hypothetical protein
MDSTTQATVPGQSRQTPASIGSASGVVTASVGGLKPSQVFLHKRRPNGAHDRLYLGQAVIAVVSAPVASVAQAAWRPAAAASTAAGLVCGWVITLWQWVPPPVLVLVFGTALLVLSLLAALIAWSRVQVGDHTPAQVLAGVVVPSHQIWSGLASVTCDGPLAETSFSGSSHLIWPVMAVLSAVSHAIWALHSLSAVPETPNAH